ncbi:hypothetical protein M3204_16950 [Mesobacillus subterraneus]|uniref:hypothetical protein n=1 Tax=Mesobacillus subterraneus TaxID=285983 RepID=UPI00203FEBFA|nr:hypothetical protein [Mesobacillus subterraneus]MCM3666109.1 hypothetical protein [Mesobacillus subterraneus]MCM3685107.1 hypothetical protein [Mesobacillus subterraneus]
MKKHRYLISLIIFMFPFLVSCNVPKIVDQDYNKVILYKISNNKSEIVSELKDKKKIEKLSDLINDSERKDAKKIAFEKGPDGILVFEKKDKKLELNIFTDTGDILTEEYYLTCNIDLAKYFDF